MGQARVATSSRAAKMRGDVSVVRAKGLRDGPDYIEANGFDGGDL